LYHDKRESDGEEFSDTNCLCLFRAAFDVLPLWAAMPPGFSSFGDTVIWHAILERGLKRAHCPDATIHYRTQWAVHYQMVGRDPPPGAKQRVSIVPLLTMPVPERMALLLGLGADSEHRSGGVTRPARRITVAAADRQITLLVPESDGNRQTISDIFDHRCYRPVDGVPAPRTILDIGADVGLSPAFFRLTYPHAAMVCVEADAEAFDFLQRNAAEIGNVRLYRTGLSNGTYAAPVDAGRMSKLTSAAAVTSGRKLVIDAGKFVASCGVEKFDLIKLDAPGAEVPIMWSLRQVLEKAVIVHVTYHAEVDRRIIHEMLAETHYLCHARIESRDRGIVTYGLKKASGRAKAPGAN